MQFMPDTHHVSPPSVSCVNETAGPSIQEVKTAQDYDAIMKHLTGAVQEQQYRSCCCVAGVYSMWPQQRGVCHSLAAAPHTLIGSVTHMPLSAQRPAHVPS